MEDRDRATARWELGTPNVASLLSRPRREIRDGGDPAEACGGRTASSRLDSRRTVLVGCHQRGLRPPSIDYGRLGRDR